MSRRAPSHRGAGTLLAVQSTQLALRPNAPVTSRGNHWYDTHGIEESSSPSAQAVRSIRGLQGCMSVLLVEVLDGRPLFNQPGDLGCSTAQWKPCCTRQYQTAESPSQPA